MLEVIIKEICFWIEFNMVNTFKLFMKSHKKLSVRACCDYLSNYIRSNQTIYNELKNYSLSLPLNTATVHRWMLRCGASYRKRKQTYFTDNYDTPENINYRNNVYIPRLTELSKRLPEWITVPNITPCTVNMQIAVDFTCYTLGVPEVPTMSEEISGVTTTYCQIHVDFLGEEAFIEYRTEMMQKHGRPGKCVMFGDSNLFIRKELCAIHSEDTCKCHSKCIKLGQDEAVFRSNSTSSMEWVVDGKSKLRAKPDGDGEMISAYYSASKTSGVVIS